MAQQRVELWFSESGERQRGVKITRITVQTT